MTTTYDENGSPTGTSWTAYYFGGAYEVRSDSTTIKYYSFGGQTIMNDDSGLKYFLTDHLGSMVAVTDENGDLISQNRYLPFGGVRVDINDITQTDYGYTGQRNLDSDIGLMDYKFRMYSPLLGRFISPDNIVPETYNPQTWNRYSYVINNPIKYNDPTGHCYIVGLDTMACIGILAITTVVLTAGIVYLNQTPEGTRIRNDAEKALQRMQQGFLKRSEKAQDELRDQMSHDGDNRHPKSDPNWCKKNMLDCIALGTTVTFVTISTVLASAICGSEAENGCPNLKLEEEPLSQNKDLNFPKNKSLPSSVTINGKKIPTIKPIKYLEAY